MYIYTYIHTTGGQTIGICCYLRRCIDMSTIFTGFYYLPIYKYNIIPSSVASSCNDA